MNLPLLGLAAITCLVVPSFASTSFIQLVDSNDSLSLYVDGSLLPTFCTTTPHLCNFAVVPTQTPGTTITSTLPLNFNIYLDPGFTILSDTLQLHQVGTDGNLGFSETFIADTDGSPLAALAGGVSVLGNGTVQTATSIVFSNGVTDVIQFQSDAPEPGYFVPMAVLGVLGFFVHRRCRRRMSRFESAAL